MALETLDRRTALEEAFESAEADAKGEEYTPPVRDDSTTEQPADDHPEPAVAETDPAKVEQDAADKPAAKDRLRTKGVPLSERGKAPVAAKEGTTIPDPATPQVSGGDKAPLGWGPTRDALWAKVPPDVRSAIAKREHEIQQGMSQAGRIRQVAEEYQSVILPFENVIRSMGSTPKAAITDVMQTATAMIVGSQEQKIAVMVELVDRYGVDLPKLDKALTDWMTNKGKGGTGQPPASAQPLDPRIMQQLQPLFQLQQRLTEAEGQKQVQLQAEAAIAINSVANEPYFADVRDDMADIMEISAKRGVVMTIKQAYDKACQLNPEVSKLLPKPGRTPSDALARARRAASTVRGAPGSAVLSGKTDRRSQLEAAWDSN